MYNVPLSLFTVKLIDEHNTYVTIIVEKNDSIIFNLQRLTTFERNLPRHYILLSQHTLRLAKIWFARYKYSRIIWIKKAVCEFFPRELDHIIRYNFLSYLNNLSLKVVDSTVLMRASSLQQKFLETIKESLNKKL